MLSTATNKLFYYINKDVLKVSRHLSPWHVNLQAKDSFQKVRTGGLFTVIVRAS